MDINDPNSLNTKAAKGGFNIAHIGTSFCQTISTESTTRSRVLKKEMTALG